MLASLKAYVESLKLFERLAKSPKEIKQRFKRAKQGSSEYVRWMNNHYDSVTRSYYVLLDNQHLKLSAWLEVLSRHREIPIDMTHAYQLGWRKPHPWEGNDFRDWR